MFMLFIVLAYEAVNILFYRQNEQKDTRISVYGFIIVISCFLQAMFGVVQFFGFFQISTTLWVTGSFDNPAGFAACLCAGFPFVGFLLSDSNKYIRYVGGLIGFVIVIAVILSQSRAGIMSIAFICFILLNMKFFHKRWVKYLSLLCFALLLSGCYWMKKDSADGRLLIWRCSVSMVKDAPWLGHGIGSFEARYMDYQADYFRQYGLNRYSMLADNVKHPFNEYLGVLINFGIVGLALLLGIVGALVYCYRQNPTQEKKIALYALLSIGVFSFFSYPFTYPFTWMVTSLAVLMLTADYLKRIKIGTWGRNIMYSAVLMGFFLGQVRLGARTQSERSWQEASVLALCHSYDEALPYYVSLKHRFEDNPYFLYNYAAVFTEAKVYEKALKVALECRKYWADYDLELLLGDIYREKKDYKQAEEYYMSASYMCPSRFLPLYQLYELYKCIGNTEKASELAKILLEKPAKVNSALIKRIRYMVKKDGLINSVRR